MGLAVGKLRLATERHLLAMAGIEWIRMEDLGLTPDSSKLRIVRLWTSHEPVCALVFSSAK